MKTIVLLMLTIFATQCHAQAAFDAYMTSKLEDAARNLRASIVSHRDVYLTSCKLNGGKDCDIYLLDDVQIVLLDLENKYRRLASTATDSESATKARQIKNLASNARDSVDELAAGIK